MSQAPLNSRLSYNNANTPLQNPGGVISNQPATQTIGTPSTMSPPLSPASKPAAPPSRQSSTTSVPPKAGSGHTQQTQQASSSISALQKIEELDRRYRGTYIPLCAQFVSNPPRDPNILRMNHSKLSESMMAQIIFKLDELKTESDDIARVRRKTLVDEVQGTLGRLDSVLKETLTAISGSSSAQQNVTPVTTYQAFSPIAELDATSGPMELPASIPSAHSATNSVQAVAANLASVSLSPISTFSTPSPQSASFPPTLTPTSPPQSTAGSSLAAGALGRPGTIRRKAPPPPKKIILATALYDFEPEEEEGEELAFFEGDTIEIVEKNSVLEEDGWCKARVRGQKKIGLAPLEYLEIHPGQPSVVGPVRPNTSAMTAVPEQASTGPAVSTTSPAIAQTTSTTTSQSTAHTASPSNTSQDIGSTAQSNVSLQSPSNNTVKPQQNMSIVHDENINLNVAQNPQQMNAGPIMTPVSSTNNVTFNTTNTTNTSSTINKPPTKPSILPDHLGHGASPPPYEASVHLGGTDNSTSYQGAAAEYYSTQTTLQPATLPPASNALPQAAYSAQVPYRPQPNQQAPMHLQGPGYTQGQMHAPNQMYTYGEMYGQIGTPQHQNTGGGLLGKLGGPMGAIHLTGALAPALATLGAAAMAMHSSDNSSSSSSEHHGATHASHNVDNMESSTNENNHHDQSTNPGNMNSNSTNNASTTDNSNNNINITNNNMNQTNDNTSTYDNNQTNDNYTNLVNQIQNQTSQPASNSTYQPLSSGPSYFPPTTTTTTNPST